MSRSSRIVRLAATLLAVPALALTACGDDEPAASTAPAAGSDPAEPTTRTFAGALGDVVVPGTPKRIVSLDDTTTNILVALNRKPAGAFLNGDDFAPALKGRTDGIEPVGKAEIDVERVAAVRPDLLIGFDTIKEDKTYSRLKSLGPIAAVARQPEEWKTWTTEMAKAVGAEDEAKKIFADYDAKVAELRPELEGQKVTIIEPMSEGKIWWYSPRFGGAMLLDELGVETQDIPKGTGLFGLDVVGEISQERVDELTGDTLVVITRSIGPEKSKELLAKPIFKDVKAVKSGDVKFIDGQSWVDLGPLNAQLVLEEAAEVLAK